MDPSEIANYVAEDMVRDNLGLNEDLHGMNVIPGVLPVDRMMAYLSENFIDWNPDEPRFQEAARKFLERVPTIGSVEQWMDLIRSSSQSESLKEKLYDLTRTELQSRPREYLRGRQYRITMHRGTRIICDEIKEAVGKKGGIYYMVGIGATEEGFMTAQAGSRKSKNPEFFERVPGIVGDVSVYRRYRWRFREILTINPNNIAKIESL